MATNTNVHGIVESYKEKRKRLNLRIEQLTGYIRTTKLKLESMESELEYQQKQLRNLPDFP